MEQTSLLSDAPAAGRFLPMPRLVNDLFNLPDSRIARWHWHSEIELTVVKRGRIICRAGNQNQLLEEGQSCFVNADVLHMFAPAPDCAEAETASVLFDPALIADVASDVYARYVAPIVSCPAMAFFPFDARIQWHRQAQSLFLDVLHADRDSCFGYELYCRNRLSDLWLLIADHMRGVYQGAAASESQYISEQRMKLMLSFIHAHYNEPVTVDAVAASASISRSECFRCFRRSIGKKPVEYLTEYRVEQALRLLREGRLTVAQVCEKCGFNSPGYFGKVFKTVTGQAPRSCRAVGLVQK